MTHPAEAGLPRRLLAVAMRLMGEAWQASRPLIRISIPIVILVKLLKEFQIIHLVYGLLTPFMELTGLPAAAGTVWAAAMLGNLYSAILVYLSAGPDLALTKAQVTVLLTMVLAAHSLPMELKVTQMVGLRMVYMGLLRFAGGVILGWALMRGYAALDLFQQPAHLLAPPQQQEAGWLAWALGELRNLLMIYLIVLALTAFLALLKRIRLDIWLERLLWPLSRLLGTSAKTASFTIIGMLAGISYGGALMLQELKRQPFSRHDILVTVSFMGLAHGLVEETLLMVVLDADISGVLVGRILLALICAMALSRLLRLRPGLTEGRLFLTPALTRATANPGE